MSASEAPVAWAHLGLAPAAAEVLALRCAAPRVLVAGPHALIAFVAAEAADGVTLRACCMRTGTCLWERLCVPASAGALVGLCVSPDGSRLLAACASAESVFVVSAADGAPLKPGGPEDSAAPSAVAKTGPAELEVAGGRCRCTHSPATGHHVLTLSYTDAQFDVQLQATTEGPTALAASPCRTALLVAASIPRGCVLRRYRLRLSPRFSHAAFRDLPAPMRAAMRELLLCLGVSLLPHVDPHTRAGVADGILAALVAAVAAEQGEALRTLSVEDVRQAHVAEHPRGLLARRLARQLGDAEPVPRARDCPRGLVMYHRALDDA